MAGRSASAAADYYAGAGSPPEQSPRAIEQRNLQRREEATARVMRKLRTGLHRTVVRTITRILMDLTRVRQNTKCEALNYVDVMRNAALEWGRRLAERKRLDGPEDVYWLSVGDLTAPGDAPLQKQVREGRREYRRWRCWVAPRVVDREGRAVRDFVRRPAPGALSGIGVSAGIAEAACASLPSRMVARGRRDPGRALHRSHVDTSLDGAQGIIAEVGSLLSHAAIVSRELGIPAVVAVHDAMRIFEDGNAVEIDGSTGEVRRLDNL